MTSPLDTTLVSKVSNWLNPTSVFSPGEQQNIQDVITAWGYELLRLTGKGDQSNDVPAVSPFNQLCSFSEVYDGNGSNRLFLRNSPIASVTSLVIGFRTIPLSTAYGQAGFVVDGSKKSLSLRGGGSGQFVSYFYPSGGSSGCFFDEGVQNIQVTYVAGYPARVVTSELVTIPSTPGPYTVLVVVLPWLSDNGVSYFVGGVPLTKVLVAPNAGEYLPLGGGTYLFNAADQGQQVQISYSAAGTPPDLQMMSTKVVALTYKQRNAIGQKSQSMAQGAGTISYDWQIDDKDWLVIQSYKRRARV